MTDGPALWRTATDKGYKDLLAPAEMPDLALLKQQRYLLTHCEGIVGQVYIHKSGDTTYAVCQRLVIREGAISHLAELVTRLANVLKKLV